MRKRHTPKGSDVNRFVAGEVHLRPTVDVGCCQFWGGGSQVNDSLFIFAPIVRGRSMFGPLFSMQYLMSVLFLQSS